MEKEICKFLKKEGLINNGTIVEVINVKNLKNLDIEPFLEHFGYVWGDEHTSSTLFVIECVMKKGNKCSKFSIKRLPYKYVKTDDADILDSVKIDSDFNIAKYITENTVAVVHICKSYRSWEMNNDYEQLTIFLPNNQEK